MRGPASPGQAVLGRKDSSDKSGPAPYVLRRREFVLPGQGRSAEGDARRKARQATLPAPAGGVSGKNVGGSGADGSSSGGEPVAGMGPGVFGEPAFMLFKGGASCIG